MSAKGATAYKEDARRIERDYVDPSSTTRAEILADLEAADFGNPDEISEWVLSAEDVGLDPSDAHRDGITTREDVERMVSEADEVGFGSERQEAVTDAVSREVAAPARDNLDRAEIQMVSQEVVTPSDVIEGDSRRSQISVIRDQNGEAVAAIGGGGSSGRDVAEHLGARHYSNIKDYTATLSARSAPDGRKALLYSGDSAVGEVDL